MLIIDTENKVLSLQKLFVESLLSTSMGSFESYKYKFRNNPRRQFIFPLNKKNIYMLVCACIYQSLIV